MLEAGTNHPGAGGNGALNLAPLVHYDPAEVRRHYGRTSEWNIDANIWNFFGDVARVALEEGWLAELLPVDGKKKINGDNDWTESILKRTKAQVARGGEGRADGKQ